MGVGAMTTVKAAAKLAFDDVASLHERGLAGWRWVVQAVRQTIERGDYADAFFAEPLGGTYELDEELGGGWGRSDAYLSQVVSRAAESSRSVLRSCQDTCL